VLPQLEAEYGATGKARFVFRHFPLRKHSFARQAAVAAVCAGRQGKFWEMHDRLFAQGAELDEPELARRAAEIRLDPSQFTKCLSADSSSEIVDRDVTSASASGVMSTPTFFFGIEEPDGRVRVKSAMSGARPIGEFRTRLDDLLSSRALPAATSR